MLCHTLLAAKLTMPIKVHAELENISQEQFGELAFELMAHVFKLHNELGGLFDEAIYKAELARRFSGIQLEVPIVVSFADFSKRYALDVLAHNACIFEFKTAERLGSQHRAQLLHYLLLCGLAHGKLVNLRGDQVEHEFVNTSLTQPQRIGFGVDDSDFAPVFSGDTAWKDWLIAVLRDWGVGLDVHLYEEAVMHCLGSVPQDVHIVIDGEIIGRQKVRLSCPEAAIKITTLPAIDTAFEQHAIRFLNHTTLQALHWVNITRKMVSFRTLHRC